MTISVVIATLNRQEYLVKLVSQILSGSIRPQEIVVVEQGDVVATQHALRSFHADLPVRVVYQKVRSLAQARNRGVAESDGEVLVFLDDDMEIDSDYLNVAKQYLQQHENVLGLTGSFMRKEPVWTIKRVIGVLFCVYSWSPRNVVLSSGSYDYIRGSALEQEQEVEWMYGGNMVVRRRVFADGHHFDDRLLRWSFGEDAIFSYGIHKESPGALRYLPNLRIVHTAVQTNKILNEEALRMKVVYRYIFWGELVRDKSRISALTYAWSQLGLSGLELIQHPSVRTFRTLVSAYVYLLQNHKRILDDTVDFNSFIFSNHEFLR